VGGGDVPPPSFEVGVEKKVRGLLSRAQECIANGSFEQAEEYLHGVLVLRPTPYDASTPTSLSSHTLAHLWLGYARQHSGDITQATQWYRDGIGALPDTDPQRPWALLNYAECLASSGRVSDAVKVGDEGVGCVRDVYGPQSSEYGAALANMAALFTASNNLEQALKYSQEAYNVMQQTVGKQNRYSEGTYHSLCYILNRLGREHEIEKVKADWANESASVPTEATAALTQRLNEFLNFLQTESPKKGIDPPGLIRSRALINDMLNAFIDSLRASGRALDVQMEEDLRAAVLASLDTPPTELQAAHVVDQALTTGELSDVQLRRAMPVEVEEEETHVVKDVDEDEDVEWLDDDEDVDDDEGDEGDEGDDEDDDDDEEEDSDDSDDDDDHPKRK